MKISPSKTQYPKYMNIAAEKIWRHVIHRYSDLIFGSKMVQDQWFRASRMFEQACKSRGLDPYVKPTSSSRLHEIAASLRSLA